VGALSNAFFGDAGEGSEQPAKVKAGAYEKAFMPVDEMCRQPTSFFGRRKLLLPVHPPKRGFRSYLLKDK
jgi:hypothetical protein